MEGKNTYLERDIKDLGFIFEYAPQYCMAVYMSDIDPVPFLSDFMHSDVRYAMEACSPIADRNNGYDCMRRFVDETYKRNAERFVSSQNRGYTRMQLRRAGELYAYAHYVTKRSSRSLVEEFGLEDVLEFCRKHGSVPMNEALEKLGIITRG